MQSLTLSACAALLIVAICLPIGVVLRRLVHSPGIDAVEAIDFPLGYSLVSILLVLSMRMGWGFIAGASFATLALIYGLIIIVRSPVRFYKMDCVIAGIIISFAVAIVFAYLPLLWGYGTVFHPPEIFDAQKHILAIAALQGSASWPPENPFMPGLGFPITLVSMLFHLP